MERSGFEDGAGQVVITARILRSYGLRGNPAAFTVFEFLRTLKDHVLRFAVQVRKKFEQSSVVSVLL